MWRIILILFAIPHTLLAELNTLPDSETGGERLEQVLQLFNGLFDPTSLPQSLIDILGSFDPLQSLQDFPNPETVLRYFEGVRGGKYLGRDATFNRFDPASLVQAIELFETLFFAPDWDTFYKTAIAARQFSNPAQFLYSFITALIHRGEPVKLPPLYEIAPQLFNFGRESNNLARKPKCEKEQKMSRFYNDPRLNSQIMMQNMRWPSWWDDKRYGKELPQRGEQFWYMNNQLLNRIDMERDALGLPPLKALDWNELSGFKDSSVSPYIGEVLGYESRILDTINKGYMVDPKEYKMVNLNDTTGIEKLVANINGRPSTLNPSFNDLGHQALLHLHSPKYRGQWDGLSDALNFQYYKRLDNILRQHKNTLPPYTRKHLSGNGLRINYVKASNLVTRRKQTNNAGVKLEFQGARSKRQSDLFPSEFPVLEEIVEQPICIEVGVTSPTNTNANIRIYSLVDLFSKQILVFCGFNETRNPQCQPDELYIEQGTFDLRLKTGNNTLIFNPLLDLENRTGIQTSCTENPYPESSYRANENLAEIQSDKSFKGYVPNQLRFPRGNATGVPHTLFFMITDGEQNSRQGSRKDRPYGFPFERKTTDKTVLNQENMFYKNIMLYHYD